MYPYLRVVEQALSYYGFLTVDYSKLEEYFTSVLDLNKNGKVDGNDVKSLFERAIEVQYYDTTTIHYDKRHFVLYPCALYPRLHSSCS